MARRKLPRFYVKAEFEWWVVRCEQEYSDRDFTYCETRAVARAVARELNEVLDRHEEQRDAER